MPRAARCTGGKAAWACSACGRTGVSCLMAHQITTRGNACDAVTGVWRAHEAQENHRRFPRGQRVSTGVRGRMGAPSTGVMRRPHHTQHLLERVSKCYSVR